MSFQKSKAAFPHIITCFTNIGGIKVCSLKYNYYIRPAVYFLEFYSINFIPSGCQFLKKDVNYFNKKFMWAIKKFNYISEM